jgi:hypothetical protein
MYTVSVLYFIVSIGLDDTQTNQLLDFICSGNFEGVLTVVFQDQLKSIKADLDESATHNFELDKVALEMYFVLWYGLVTLCETKNSTREKQKVFRFPSFMIKAQEK